MATYGMNLKKFLFLPPVEQTFEQNERRKEGEKYGREKN